ncbi:hypothetical protein V8E36_008968 [Tilletia maclaganii]
MDRQSLLLWGLTDIPGSHSTARPMATRLPPSRDDTAKRFRLASTFNDNEIAGKINDLGYIDFPSRRRLSERFGVQRSKLTEQQGATLQAPRSACLEDALGLEGEGARRQRCLMTQAEELLRSSRRSSLRHPLQFCLLPKGSTYEDFE